MLLFYLFMSLYDKATFTVPSTAHGKGQVWNQRTAQIQLWRLGPAGPGRCKYQKKRLCTARKTHTHAPERLSPSTGCRLHLTRIQRPHLAHATAAVAANASASDAATAPMSSCSSVSTRPQTGKATRSCCTPPTQSPPEAVVTCSPPSTLI
jgi:hypothetical protein